MSDYISHTLQSSWVSFLMDLATWTAPQEPSRDIQVCVFTLPQHKSASNLKILHEMTRSVPLRLSPNHLLCGKLYFGISWPGMDWHLRPVFILPVGYCSLHFRRHTELVYIVICHTLIPMQVLSISVAFQTFHNFLAQKGPFGHLM